MTGLEKITARIQARGREQASEILQRAEADCREIEADYSARAATARERIRLEGLAAGEETVNRTRNAIAKTERELMQGARARMLDKAFEAARTEICSTDYGKYRELLIALLVCALLEQDRVERESLALGDEVAEFACFEVLMNEQDRERFGQAVVDGARRVTERRIGYQKAQKIQLCEQTVPIDGGLVLRFGNVELNCSLALVLADLRREIEPQIAAVLFESET